MSENTMVKIVLVLAVLIMLEVGVVAYMMGQYQAQMEILEFEKELDQAVIRTKAIYGGI